MTNVSEKAARDWRIAAGVFNCNGLLVWSYWIIQSLETDKIILSYSNHSKQK